MLKLYSKINIIICLMYNFLNKINYLRNLYKNIENKFYYNYQTVYLYIYKKYYILLFI